MLKWFLVITNKVENDTEKLKFWGQMDPLSRSQFLLHAGTIILDTLHQSLDFRVCKDTLHSTVNLPLHSIHSLLWFLPTLNRASYNDQQGAAKVMLGHSLGPWNTSSGEGSGHVGPTT